MRISFMDLLASIDMIQGFFELGTDITLEEFKMWLATQLEEANPPDDTE